MPASPALVPEGLMEQELCPLLMAVFVLLCTYPQYPAPHSGVLPQTVKRYHMPLKSSLSISINICW